MSCSRRTSGALPATRRACCTPRPGSSKDFNSLRNLLNEQRLPAAISTALQGGLTLLVPSVQRQAAVRAAWAASQRDQGRTLWTTPGVLTLNQFCERAIA